MNLNLQKITQFNSPKVVIEKEKFEYNYYVDVENVITDKTFKTSISPDRTKSVIAKDLVPPRKVLLSLDTINLINFNNKIENRKGNILLNNPGLKTKLSNLSNLQSINEEVRSNIFNERFNLNLRFYQENNIDLTFDEDLSFMYDIMLDAFDTEEPDNVISNIDSNRPYLQYSKKLEEYNSPQGVSLRRKQKLGNNSTKNIEYIERLNKANNNKYTGFLDDKSVLNNKNYKENIFFKKFESLEEELISKLANNNKRKEFINPKILFSTAQYINQIENQELGNDQYEYTVGSIAGYIVDKYKVDENLNKEYLCTKFYQVGNDRRVEIEDTAIQYGKKYIYEIKTVHLFLLKKSESGIDFHNFVLVLGDKTTSNIVHIVERESPNIPTSLICSYNKEKQGIRLRWGMPSNPQLDIFNFQVFRRESLFEPFTLIKEIRELDINVNSDEGFEEPNQESIDKSGIKFNFLDTEIKKDKTYIYAICAIDAHGISSALSAQVACKYNRILSRLDVDTVSLGGALKYYPNQFIPRKTKFFDNERSVFNNTPVVKNKDKFKIYFTPDYQAIKTGPSDFQEIVKTIDNVVDNKHNANNASHYIFNLTNINTLSHKSQNIYIKK